MNTSIIGQPRPQSRSGDAPEAPSSNPDYLKAVKKMYAPADFSLTPPIFAIVTCAVLYAGWNAELDHYINPETGAGYWLGIVGGIMLLLMALYPLRKRALSMRRWGPTRYWFKSHMAMGIIAPTLILYHCNFALGATNSNVSLVAMAIVVISGITGRYIYGKIHYGVYGNQFDLEQLRVDKAVTDRIIRETFEKQPALYHRLSKFEQSAMKPSSGISGGLTRLLFTGTRARLAYLWLLPAVNRALKEMAEESGWSAEEAGENRASVLGYIAAHLNTVVRIVQYAFFERVFSIWHVLHIPFYVILLVSGIYHVIAVHMY